MNSSDVRAIVLVCLASLLGSPRPAHAEWTLAVFVGGTRTQDSSLTITQPARSRTDVKLTPIHYGGESFEPPIYYGYRVGAFPRGGRWGVEGEFVHMKVIADVDRMVDVEGEGVRRPLRSVIERFSISHGVNFLFVNGVARWRAKDARWLLVGRFGAGPTIPHPESTIDGRSLEQYEWGALAVQGAGAIELRVHRALYVMGEYKLTRTAQDVSIVDGTARTPLVSHHVVAGITVHLGQPRPGR